MFSGPTPRGGDTPPTTPPTPRPSHGSLDLPKYPQQRPTTAFLVLPHLLLVFNIMITIHGWATEGGEKEEEEAAEEEEWEEQEEEGEDDHTPSRSDSRSSRGSRGGGCRILPQSLVYARKFFGPFQINQKPILGHF